MTHEGKLNDPPGAVMSRRAKEKRLFEDPNREEDEEVDPRFHATCSTWYLVLRYCNSAFSAAVRRSAVASMMLWKLERPVPPVKPE